MFSVIFEVRPSPRRFDDYLSLAQHLKPMLQAQDGFLENERSRSLRRPGWLLSHSAWRDEKAAVRWRTHGEHHRVQERGREEVFDDYRLRVGEVLLDSHPPAGGAVRPQRFDATEVGAAKCMSLTEIKAAAAPRWEDAPELLAPALGLALPREEVLDQDVFASLTVEGKFVLLVSWRNEQSALQWRPGAPVGAHADVHADADSELQLLRHRCVRVVRDYGLHDRREAPQFYPPVERERTR